MKFLGFLATAYLARVLGKSGFGAINVGQSVLSYATVLSTGGLLIYGTRKVAASQESKLIAGEIFYGRLSLSIIVFIIAAALTFILSGFTENSYIILSFILCLFPTAFFLEWFFVGVQKMEKVAYARIIGIAVYLIIIAVVIKERNDAVFTGVAYTLGAVATALLFILFYKKEGYSFHFEKGKNNFLKSLKESFPLGIASYISQFIAAFPVIYIAFIAGNSEAGVFSAALKMIGLFLIFDRIFVTLFLPKITNVISTNESSLEEIFNKVLKINIFITLSASIFLFIFSEFIIIKVFGAEYVEAILIFRLLLIYFIFTVIDSVFANTLIGLMKEKIYTVSLLIALIVFLIMTFTLSPFLGVYGVIYSFIIINVISLSYMVYFLKKEIKIFISNLIILPLLLTGLSFLFLIFFEVSFYAELAIASFIFIPLLVVILKVGKEEVNFIKRIFI